MFTRRSFLGAAAALSLQPLSALAQAQRAIMLGVVGYGESAVAASLQYEGLTDYLGRSLKQRVLVESSRDFTAFAERAKAKRYQFLFAAPSAIIDANRAAGYEPLVKAPGRLAASFMAAGKSGIAFVEDMKGKRIGFSGKNAMITKLAFHELKQLGIADPARHFSAISYHEDVETILVAMKTGMVDVGVANAGFAGTWTNRGEDLNVIHIGQGVPHLTFAVRGGMPAPEKVLLSSALLKAHEDKSAADFLRRAGIPHFEPAKMADYKELEKILGRS